MLSDISGNVLTNNGAIDGGDGGGLGLKVEMAATLTNNGSITGGAGESGAGGPGADLRAGTLTLTNTGSLAGGAGASNTKGLPGGAGGAGAVLNGGTLITSGTISGGAGGTGSSNGAMGDAVKFGTVASTLIVDPGAVFNGQVVANATVNDVLELSGTQLGGTAITLGTQFTHFSTLTFASGAAGTVDATKADLTAHTLSIDGFAIGDTLDITNVAKAGTTQSFNSTTDQLTLTHGATVIKLDFDSAFTGDHFVLTAAGSGTDLTLASGAHAVFASLGHDVRNFVSDHHRALTDGRIMPMYDPGSSVMPTANTAASDLTGYSFASHALIDHGVAHAVLGVCKA